MRIILTLLAVAVFTTSIAQNKEEEAIRSQAKIFSSNLMNGELDQVVAMYTEDAKIFPNNREILEGQELANYWNPSGERKWRTSYHKITPVEIKVFGDEAYDYGYYEGTSTDGTQSSNWKGKYVIIWRKVDDVWKIYLDIWNRIPIDE
ncbi:MAG: YybH family protein [Salibacteraceae bacterium]